MQEFPGELLGSEQQTKRSASSASALLSLESLQVRLRRVLDRRDVVVPSSWSAATSRIKRKDDVNHVRLICADVFSEVWKHQLRQTGS